MLIRKMNTPERVAFWRHIDAVVEMVAKERPTYRKERVTDETGRSEMRERERRQFSR